MSNRSLQPFRPWGSWPTPNQELLLGITVGSDEKALASWKVWNQRVSIQDVDAPSAMLLPYALHRLLALGVKPDQAERLRGLSRKTWVENQLHRDWLIPIIAPLDARRIPMIPIRGIGLQPLYANNLRLRKFSGTGLLVPPDRFNEAKALLIECGLKQDGRLSLASGPVLRDGRQYIRLHRVVSGWFTPAEADTAIWNRTRDDSFGNLPFKRLGTVDELVTLAAASPQREFITPAAWLFDLARCLDQDVQWNVQAVLEEVQKRHLLPLLSSALTFLSVRTGMSIPGPLIETLRSAATTPLERVSFPENEEIGSRDRLMAFWIRHTLNLPNHSLAGHIFSLSRSLTKRSFH